MLQPPPPLTKRVDASLFGLLGVFGIIEWNVVGDQSPVREISERQ